MEKRWQYRFGSSADPVWDPSPSTIFVKNISLFPKMKCISKIFGCFEGCALLVGCSPLRHTETIINIHCMLQRVRAARRLFPFETYTNKVSFHAMFERVRAASRLFPFRAYTNLHQKSSDVSKGARCSSAVPL